MRVAYVGNFEPEYSTENDVRKAFEHLGHEVVKLQEGDQYNRNKAPFSKVREEALSSDLLLWTGTWGDAYGLGEVLGLFHDLAVKGIPTATLHLDTFWSTVRDGRRWWLEPMFHTAYIFTADGDYQKEWKLLGKNHVWLPPAVRHDAAHFGMFNPKYECDVAFVGSNGQGYHEDVWPDRKILVDNLREMCRKNGWSFKNPGGDEPKILRGEDMNDFYASAKVTVGDSLCLKKRNSHYWSDRVPEALGRGGFLIMPLIDALGEDFEFYGNHETIFPWGNYEALEHTIEFFLSARKQRERINKINQKNVAKNHTYVNRVQTILKEVGLDD